MNEFSPEQGNSDLGKLPERRVHPPIAVLPLLPRPGAGVNHVGAQRLAFGDPDAGELLYGQAQANDGFGRWAAVPDWGAAVGLRLRLHLEPSSA